MTLKKVIPFCCSVPVGLFGIVPMEAYLSHGKIFEGILFPCFILILALAMHMAVKNACDGKVTQTPAERKYNIDGTLMNSSGSLDMNSNPFGSF